MVIGRCKRNGIKSIINLCPHIYLKWLIIYFFRSDNIDTVFFKKLHCLQQKINAKRVILISDRIYFNYTKIS